MAQPGVISEYAERLARELDFDPSLARGVRREVEDHLWEAVSADPAGDRSDAEQRAVAKFGDPHAIAAQFAVVSVARQARTVSRAGIFVVAAVFMAMKARLGWYAVMEYPAPPSGALSAVVLSIDRGAFWVALLVAMVAWMYIGTRPIPSALTPDYRLQLRRFFRLCVAATGALLASVLCDGVLTSIRLAGTASFLEAVVPLASMAGEVVCAAGLLWSIRGMTRRTASASRAARMR